MNNNLKVIFTFVLGAAAGSAVTWKFVKTKYEELAQEEIAEIREFYRAKMEPTEDTESCDNGDENIRDEYEEETSRYVTYSNENEEKGGSEPMSDYDDIRVIPPEEFGEDEEYETESLTYYADGVLVDQFNIPINNVNDVVGTDSLSHFGEYEDDSVFVMNDRLRCYYEILLDNREYPDTLNDSLLNLLDED